MTNPSFCPGLGPFSGRVFLCIEPRVRFFFQNSNTERKSSSKRKNGNNRLVETWVKNGLNIFMKFHVCGDSSLKIPMIFKFLKIKFIQDNVKIFGY